MLQLNIWKLSVLALCMLPLPAQAGNLEGLAKANNAFHRESKTLGLNPTSRQLENLRAKHFNPPLRAYFAENRTLYARFKSMVSGLFDKADTDDFAQGAKAGSDDKDEGGAAGGAPGGAAKAPAAPARNTTTGESEGADGAKAVGFGGKREKPKDQPKVVDGIIME